MLYIVGDTGTRDINIKLNNEQTITAVNCMKLMHDGHDEDFHKELNKLPKVAKKCIDALCWEAEETLNIFINLLESDGRFAVCHGAMEFGISTRRAEAKAAWKKEEF